MPRKEIDFILRSDALEKNGGDGFQIDQYCRNLTKKYGFDIRCIPFHVSMNLRPNSIVHIVNVDRPFDFLAAVRIAADRPIVVSSIHHDLGSVREMRKAERNQGLRTLVGRVLPESGRELLAFSVRTAKKVRSSADCRKWVVTWLRSLPTAATVWRTVGRTLDRVDAVALLAEGERDSLTRDTKWLGRNGKLIPNGKPTRSIRGSSEPALAWADRIHDICVVGRIEPRKRQLEIARAAAIQGQRVVFVGHPSASSPRYVADFEAAVAQDPNLLWVGGLEHEEVLDLMGNSRVLLNGSWVEVQSLVDIEGAAAGCWVVVGRGGNSSEWLGGSVVAVDTHDVSRLVLEATDLLRSNLEPIPTDYAHTWEMASEKLADVYAQL